MTDTEVLFTTGPIEEYGEWGCHVCLSSFAGERDLSHASAYQGARKHLEATGHDVFIVQGTARALHADQKN